MGNQRAIAPAETDPKRMAASLWLCRARCLLVAMCANGVPLRGGAYLIQSAPDEVVDLGPLRRTIRVDRRLYLLEVQRGIRFGQGAACQAVQDDPAGCGERRNTPPAVSGLA